MKEEKTFLIKNGFWKASFTVEAALLMTIILPVLAALLISGFYLHDSALLQGACCELAARTENTRLQEDSASSVQNQVSHWRKNKMLWTKSVNGSVSVGEDQVKVTFSGSFHIPGLIAKFLCGNTITISKSTERALPDPAEKIRLLLGMLHIADSLSS